MYSSNLGLTIAIVVALGLAAVLAFIGSLLVSNLKAGAQAREMAAQAGREAQQKMRESRMQDLRPLVESLRGFESAGSASDWPIRFDIRVPHEVVPVFGIETELEELLSKVARYAARVMSPGATLQVSARVESGQAVVHWRDLDASDASPPLARFLEATQAVGHASARVCERIASRHGGRIYAAPHAGGALGLTLRLPLPGQTTSSAG
ncbi:ATP-binding protein [Variovorax paradoxus]|nr:ATP-binding protein [Variovorax paradoxus]